MESIILNRGKELKIITHQIVVYIPGLKKIITDRVSSLKTKLQPASSDGIIDVRERQTLYVISATVGESFFDSITMDYAKNLITFNQVDRSNKKMAEAVLDALRELGIEEFTSHSMSFCMFPPNRTIE